MEKHNKSAFQRVLAFALTLIMVVGMLPMNVTALEPSDRATVTPKQLWIGLPPPPSMAKAGG